MNHKPVGTRTCVVEITKFSNKLIELAKTYPNEFPHPDNIREILAINVCGTLEGFKEEIDHYLDTDDCDKLNELFQRYISASTELQYMIYNMYNKIASLDEYDLGVRFAKTYTTYYDRDYKTVDMKLMFIDTYINGVNYDSGLFERICNRYKNDTLDGIKSYDNSSLLTPNWTYHKLKYPKDLSCPLDEKMMYSNWDDIIFKYLCLDMDIIPTEKLLHNYYLMKEPKLFHDIFTKCVDKEKGYGDDFIKVCDNVNKIIKLLK